MQSYLQRQPNAKKEGGKKAQVIYVELDVINFKSAFNKVMAICGRNISDFEDERKTHFWPRTYLVKSNKEKGQIVKA